MAKPQKRRNKDGTYSYRMQIRNNDGHPPESKTFPTFQEAARRRQAAVQPVRNTTIGYQFLIRPTVCIAFLHR